MNDTVYITLSYEKISSRKLQTMHVIPVNKLITISQIYAVLGSLNQNEAGYITGVMDQLQNKSRQFKKNYIF